jgi:hypothetical protein
VPTYPRGTSEPWGRLNPAPGAQTLPPNHQREPHVTAISAALFALVLNIPTIVFSRTLPASTTGIMFVSLALLGLALGGLFGWAIEQEDRTEDWSTSTTQDAPFGEDIGQLAGSL